MKFRVFSFSFLFGLALSASAAFAQTTITYAVEYTYDAQSRLTRASYSGNASVTYNYDTTGNLLGVVTDAADDVATEEETGLPVRFELQGNYPNPFNPVTTILFDLPETAQVQVELIDVLGRRVLALPARTVQAGFRRALSVDASELASGVYFYRVSVKTKARVQVKTGRVVMIK